MIALMAKPYACPHGRCTYCPGGIEYNSPNSYTGNEPSTTSAIESGYDPKKQILSKIAKLVAYGHDSVKHRNVGFTIETKPDYCRKEHIDSMLTYGATRIEIGVQSLQQDVLKRSNRGHGFDEIVESFQEAKDAGYKIAAHMMPGLPGATIKDDLADFESLYSDARLVPDMLKDLPHFGIAWNATV